MNNDDPRLLLPFAAAGRLSRDDMQRVQALLESSPEARAEFAWWQSVARDLRMESPAAEAAMQGDLGLARFKARLAEIPQAAVRKPRSSVWDWFRSSWMAPALAACAAVIVVQGLMLDGVLGPQEGGITTLSGPTTADGAQLTIAFQPQASEATIRALLAEVRGEIVGGPSALGLYRLRIQGDPAQAQARLAAAREVVADVAVLK